MGGPLAGVRVVEMAGLAPVPFGGMLLADLGAEVVRIDRAAAGAGGLTPPPGPLDRGKTRTVADLKNADDVRRVVELASRADVFVEGYRPGVAERLGIGPDVLTAANPRLIYVRLTGWGQQGPLADRAGHDIDYISLVGALDLIGRPGQPPVPPGAFLGDLAGGGMLMALGVTSALYERERSGRGQVLDVAMVDGAALLTTFFHGLRAGGMWSGRRGENLIDGGRACYDCYQAADGKYVAVGALEPQFFAQLIDILGIDATDLPPYLDPAGTQAWRDVLSAAFANKPRDEWAEIFAETDACVAPVLSPWEAHQHPHNRARNSYITVDDLIQPAPAPRFSRTPAAHPEPIDSGELAALLDQWSTPDPAVDGVDR
ncbi:CaiB/BaiF CoA transferase family protein [[Mycobacterium] nativiensis]|uniref:CaiB/BaiF CoA-transferase family protein n=1 Tax=[Mycobacterium] nativiensis TaxID=2855503 RepID=A0ABU5XVR3_9MYCO|nr:CaiB/BaiF CoA-transferase family protein [Mycolicibacter sp. MYC340]MEB3031882.1 CaiB/BaiF CoA-transferase family protein [Mycolicibacter sp. MYC340]